MQKKGLLKALAFTTLSIILSNCSPVTFANKDNASAIDETQLDAPATEPIPIVVRPKVTRCDLLVDQTGIYFGFGGSQSNYVAITGVTECQFNEINNIEGPCDNDAEITILAPEDKADLNNPDLALDNGQNFTILPQGQNKTFLCVSSAGTAVIGYKNMKMILVGEPAP